MENLGHGIKMQKKAFQSHGKRHRKSFDIRIKVSILYFDIVKFDLPTRLGVQSKRRTQIENENKLREQKTKTN